MPKTTTVSLYNLADGIYGRPKGEAYLDRVQAWNREQLDAFVDGRDPDVAKANSFRTVGTAAQLFAEARYPLPPSGGEDSRVVAQALLDSFVATGASTIEPIGEMEIEVEGEETPKPPKEESAPAAKTAEAPKK